MNKDYLAPLAVFAIVFVGTAFLITSAIVSVTNGKSSFWTSKKMRLGAWLITLNSCVMSGCFPACQTTCYDTASPNNGGEDPQVMCYDMPATNVVHVNTKDFEEKKSNAITGSVFDPEFDEYSYLLVRNKTNDTIQKGDFKLQVNDTVPYEHNFSIEINAKLDPGRYWFHVCKKGDLDYQFESSQINIQ